MGIGWTQEVVGVAATERVVLAAHLLQEDVIVWELNTLLLIEVCLLILLVVRRVLLHAVVHNLSILAVALAHLHLELFILFGQQRLHYRTKKSEKVKIEEMVSEKETVKEHLTLRAPSSSIR